MNLTQTQNIDLALPVQVTAQNLNKQLALLSSRIDQHNSDKNNAPIDRSEVDAAQAHALSVISIVGQHIVKAATPLP